MTENKNQIIFEEKIKTPKKNKKNGQYEELTYLNIQKRLQKKAMHPKSIQIRAKSILRKRKSKYPNI